MKVKYDEKADRIYVSVGSQKVARTEEIDKDVSIDYDKKGRIVGIEVLHFAASIVEGLSDV